MGVVAPMAARVALGAAASAGLAFVAYAYRKQLRAWLRRVTYSPSASLDECARSLDECGVATLAVSKATSELHARSFAAAKVGLDICADANSPLAISPDADSAHASGIHAAGALSQYNVCREGLIFSDGGTIELGDAAFEQSMAAFFDSAVEHAAAVLTALERRLAIPEGWFEENLGPIRDHSQWHLKRYRPEHSPSVATCSDGRRVLLPVHSDPSLISVVVHDRPGTQAGAMGLEYMLQDGEWREVRAHGHGVVTVFVGRCAPCFATTVAVGSER